MDCVMAAVFAGGIVQIDGFSLVRRSRGVILFFVFLNQIRYIKSPYHIANEQEEYSDVDKKLFHVSPLYNMLIMMRSH